MNRQPSIRSANWLYLFTMLLVISLGAWMQSLHIFWGLIGTEVFIILLPAYIFVRAGNLDLRDTLRLRWPGLLPMLLGLLVGIGLWPLSITLDSISAMVFGYVPPQPFTIPTTLPEQVVYLVSLVIFAPICEEILFRGYILRAYDRLKTPLVVLIVGLLFASYHLRFQGLLALLPISLALGWMALKTRSIYPAMLAHFATNGLSGFFSLADPSFQNAVSNSWSTLLGTSLALTIGSLWLLRRSALIAPAPPAKVEMTAVTGEINGTPIAVPLEKGILEDHPPQTQPDRTARLVGLLPLLLALLIYTFFAGVEWNLGHSPELLAKDGLSLRDAPWSQPQALSYEIRNIIDQKVGTAQCQVTLEKASTVLACTTRQEAFDVNQGQSHYLGGKSDKTVTMNWQPAPLRLIAYNLDQQGDNFSLKENTRVEGEGLLLEVTDQSGEKQTLQVPAGAVLISEWQWYFTALPFETVPPEGYKFQLAWSLRYNQSRQKSIPALDLGMVQVVGKETVSVPAGEFTAWKVILSYKNNGSRTSETAWYDINHPGRLLKYTDNSITYLLIPHQP